MNQVTQLIAVGLEWLKLKDPKYFTVAQLALGAAVVFLKDADLSGYNEHVQLFLMGVMAFTSSSTKNFLPETHPAKKKINAEIYNKADQLKEKESSVS